MNHSSAWPRPCGQCRSTGTKSRRSTTPLDVTIDPPLDPHDGAPGNGRGDSPGGVTSCDTAREWISARLDGEATGDERRLLEAHLAHCAGCRAHAGALDDLTRHLRVRPAEDMPDLVGTVTSRVRPARLGRGGWLRPALAWVAVVMLVQSLPALLYGEVAGTSTHLARHLGAFGAALAIGFAFAAWKPHRAFGLLPFTAALVATTTLSIVADVASGARTPLAELIHVTELVGLTLLWMIAGSPGWRWGTVRQAMRRSAVRGGSAPLGPLQ